MEDAAVAGILCMAEADLQRKPCAALGARIECEHSVRQIDGRYGHAHILAEVRDDGRPIGRIVSIVVAGIAAGGVARAAAAAAAVIVARSVLPVAGIGRLVRVSGRRGRLGRAVRLLRRGGRLRLAGRLVLRQINAGIGADAAGASGRECLRLERFGILFARVCRLDALHAAHGEYTPEQQRRRQHKAERAQDRLIVHVRVSFLRLPAGRSSSAGER